MKIIKLLVLTMSIVYILSLNNASCNDNRSNSFSIINEDNNNLTQSTILSAVQNCNNYNNIRISEHSDDTDSFHIIKQSNNDNLTKIKVLSKPNNEIDCTPDIDSQKTQNEQEDKSCSCICSVQ